jgi:hypothetical protein
MSFRSTGVLIGLLLLGAPLATADDIPLRDWTVPSTSSRLSALSDIGNPGVFVAVTPCRVVDTRLGMGFSGAYGPPALTTSPRTFNIVASGCTGLPANVSAFSLNFTVTNTAGPGHIIAWPAGGTMPNVSTINYVGAQTLANAAIVPAGSGTSISVIAAVSATDFIIDINGYFTNYPNTNKQLFTSGSFSAAAAMVGFNYSNTNGSHGVGGYAGGTGVVHGVQGEIGTGAAAMSAGVHGIGYATTARTFGVYGESAANVNDAAGVLGRTTVGTPPIISDIASPAGVRGEGASRGTVGIAGPSGVGVRGYSVDAAGTLQMYGSLGQGNSYGVYASGNLGASGTKTFVEPHPTDPSKVIKFVSLEGPEAGTYFRGTSSTRGGVCVIEVPESFRMVTDEEGLTVQVTTVGSPARAWVESESLDRIVVRASADTKLHYLVQGVRKAYRDFQPVVPGDEFMPSSPEDTLPLWLSEEGRRRLVSNGTFHPDGTVNMETAERAGWARRWREAELVHE